MSEEVVEKLSDAEAIAWARAAALAAKAVNDEARRVWSVKVDKIRVKVTEDVAKMTRVQMVEYVGGENYLPAAKKARAGEVRSNIITSHPWRLAPLQVQPFPWVSCAFAGLNEIDELARLKIRMSDTFDLYREGRASIDDVAKMVAKVKTAELLAENWVYVFHSWKRLGEFLPAVLHVRDYSLRHGYLDSAEADAFLTFARSVAFDLVETD